MATATKRNLASCLIAGIVAALPAPSYSSAQTNCLTVLAAPNEVAKSVIPEFQKKLADHGICIKFQFAPAKRASVMLNSGRIDGEFLRTPEYLETVRDSAFMVDEPVLEGFGLLVSRKLEPLSSDDMKGRSIGMRLGFRWQERVVTGEENRIYVDGYKTGLAMLANKHIDGLLIDNFSFKHLQKGYGDLESVQVTPKTAVHLFLHNRNHSIADNVNRAITEWRREFFGPKTN